MPQQVETSRLYANERAFRTDADAVALTGWRVVGVRFGPGRRRFVDRWRLKGPPTYTTSGHKSNCRSFARSNRRLAVGNWSRAVEGGSRLPMRWFDWIKPTRCEIPGCGQEAARSAYILAASRAWLCEDHAAALDVGAPVRAKR